MTMKYINRLFIGLATAGMLLSVFAGSAGASPLTYNGVCPSTSGHSIEGTAGVGNATDCNLLIVFGPGGAITTTGTMAGTYETIDDSLIGVVNNSGQTLLNFTLSGPGDPFAFDIDGIDVYVCVPSDCSSPGSSIPNNSDDSTGPVRRPAGVLHEHQQQSDERHGQHWLWRIGHGNRRDQLCAVLTGHQSDGRRRPLQCDVLFPRGTSRLERDRERGGARAGNDDAPRDRPGVWPPPPPQALFVSTASGADGERVPCSPSSPGHVSDAMSITKQYRTSLAKTRCHASFTCTC